MEVVKYKCLRRNDGQIELHIHLHKKFIFKNILKLLTGGGKDLYRITTPANMSKTSLAIIILVNAIGIKSAYVNVKNNVPIRTLSAIGSRKLPIFED